MAIGSLTTLTNHLLYKNFPNSNVVFSPISIHAVLGLVAAGSKGQTLNQLLSFLKTKSVNELNAFSSQLVSSVLVDGSQSGGLRLSYANGVSIDQTLPLKPSFKQVVYGVYKATSNQVDFQTKGDKIAREVNLWAENQTSGLIKQIIRAGAVTLDTRLIFANAVYFKGTWKEKFNPSETKDYDFHLLNGSIVQTPFMSNNYTKQYVGIYRGFKVLGLPYLWGKDKRRFTMYLFLPNAKDGLPSLIEKICSESEFLERHLPNQKLQVGLLSIPKFKISFAFEASEMLKELGLVLPFSSDGEGLTEMVEGGNRLYVSSIHHKSVLEVKEEGTEAAAVSAGILMLTSTNHWTYDKVDFVADHPFLFVIREDTTGVVLFTGQVTDPRDS